ncbi:MAG: FAD-binding oxidoreductase [Candidatus Bathyarchaeia archaeon]
MNQQKMPEQAYKALEDIVGPEHITDDPAVLESYSFVWGNEKLFGSRLAPFRPLAVVMPGNAEEAQAIVKVCNRFKIKFKAHSTGFAVFSLVAKEPFLVIDLRRLNRILLIDERNMVAVVEPYVSHAELFYECLKKGLRFNALGAGPSASVVASSACHEGAGFHCISSHFDGQNLLGVEWVLPDGEMVRLGSMATDSGWFTADGPGLSLRAVLRGRIGANGGLGIITKVAVKLAPWYGPPRLNVKGEPPLYECELPENFRLHVVTFPSIEPLVEFLRHIEEEQIAFAAYKLPLGGVTLIQVTTESNDKAWEKYMAKKETVEKTNYSVIVLLDAISPREIEVKEECFNKILEKTGGETLPLDKQEESALLAQLLIGLGTFRESFRAAGSFLVASFYDSSYDSCVQLVEATEKTLLKYVEEGKIVFMPGECWLSPFGGQWCHLEQVYGYDAADPQSVKATQEITSFILQTMLKNKFGIWGDGVNSYDDSVHDQSGPLCLNYHLKIRAIKKAFDPNMLSDATFYTMPKE